MRGKRIRPKGTVEEKRERKMPKMISRVRYIKKQNSRSGAQKIEDYSSVMDILNKRKPWNGH